MKLTQDIQRMLNALALANAGENLNRRQKDRALAGSAAPVAQPEPLPAVAGGPQIGLYLGSELPTDVMQYVIQTCSRLRHGLRVLTFQSENEAHALLAPYRVSLAAAGIEPELSFLAGEPPAALVHALRKRPDVAFLICNETGYLGRSLLKGSVRRDAIPVPVVLVATGASAIPQHAPAEAPDAASRVA
jgi:hypothetical protein